MPGMAEYWQSFFNFLAQYSADWIKLAGMIGGPIWESAMQSVQNSGVVLGVKAVFGLLASFVPIGFARAAWKDDEFGISFLVSVFALLVILVSISAIGVSYDMVTNPEIHAFERLVR